MITTALIIITLSIYFTINIILTIISITVGDYRIKVILFLLLFGFIIILVELFKLRF